MKPQFIKIDNLEDKSDERLFNNFASDLSFLGFSNIDGNPIFKVNQDAEEDYLHKNIFWPIASIGGTISNSFSASDVEYHLEAERFKVGSWYTNPSYGIAHGERKNFIKGIHRDTLVDDFDFKPIENKAKYVRIKSSEKKRNGSTIYHILVFDSIIDSSGVYLIENPDLEAEQANHWYEEEMKELDFDPSLEFIDLETYTVKEGDTLSQISRNENFPMSMIMIINEGIQHPDLIKIGEKIKLISFPY